MKTSRTRKRDNRAGNQNGFSLLEMVIVLGIIGLILGTATALSMKIVTVAKIKSTEGRLGTLRTQLLAYQSHTGNYPTESQGLQALVEKPNTPPVPRKWERLTDFPPQDAWKRDYEYKFPGSVQADQPEVISAGPDGVFGTGDDLSSQAELGG